MNRRIFTLLFFVSGLSGLMYQILWTRLFSFVLGNTYLAISMIVAAFLFGLFLGSWLIGLKIHRSLEALKWYAILELLIGGYALALLGGFGVVESVYQALNAAFGESALLYSFGKFLLTLLLVLIPTTAMGATLPLVVQYYTHTRKVFGNTIALFYSVNTLGGALGVVAAGFFIIERLGIREGIILTAILNILIGCIVLLTVKSGRERHPAGQTVPSKSRPQKRALSLSPAVHRAKFLYWAAAALAGFAALSYEIIWTRGLKFLIQNSTYSFAVILATFLGGIALGSIISRRLRQRSLPATFIYGILQIALGLYAVLTIYLLYEFSESDLFQNHIIKLFYDYSYSWEWGIVAFFLTCSIIFLIPAVMMGILFPLINDIFYQEIQEIAGRTVSSIYAFNTVGSILGSLGAGFLFIPLWGIKDSILLVSAVNFLLGTVFVLKSRYRLIPTFGISLVLLLPVFNLSLEGKYLQGHEERKQDRVLFYKEGLMSTVKVFESGTSRRMSIDGQLIASTGRNLLQKEKLIAHLPFFINPNIRTVLSVGLASGISVGSMSLQESVETIDCVELIEAVFPAARHFMEYNYDIFNNQKINLIHNDIYAYLKYTEGNYELISSDGKLGAFYSGNTIMLARDYFNLCKNRLTQNGLFIHWVPIITPHEILKIILDTLKSSFRHVALFYFYPSDIFMVASQDSIFLDRSLMDRVWADQKVADDLKQIHIKNTLSILSSFMGFYETNPPENQPLNTFNQPILEFAYFREWKKRQELKGGYRAENMAFLVDNFTRAGPAALASRIKQMDEALYIKQVYEPSVAFYEFNVLNFQIGNYRSGLRAYRKWKNNLHLFQE